MADVPVDERSERPEFEPDWEKVAHDRIRELVGLRQELQRLTEIEEAARETLNTLEAWSLADGGLHVSAAEELAERRDDLHTALDADRGGQGE